MKSTHPTTCAMLFLAVLLSASHAAPLRVVTFNVLGELDTPGTSSFEDVAAILARIDADVVALQELTSDSANLIALGERLGLPHIFYEDHASMRNGLLSKYPFSSSRVIYEFGMTRPILLAAVDMPKALQDPWVASLHLKCCDSDDGSEQRTRAIELFWLKNELTNHVPAAAPVMLMGDFNLVSPSNRSFAMAGSLIFPDPLEAPADADGYFPELGIFKMDARHAGDGGESWTWRGDYQFPPGALDHIMVNEIIRVRSNAVEIFDVEKDAMLIAGLPKNGSPLPPGSSAGSDHLPVFADVDIESYPADLKGLTYDQRSSNTFAISWQPATDADSYNILIDNEFYTNTTATGFDYTLTNENVHLVTVIPTNHLGQGLGQTITIQADANPHALLAQADPYAFDAMHLFTGIAGSGLNQDIVWSNQLTGATGSFPAGSTWTTSVPVAVGTNSIVFTASYPSSEYSYRAFDLATNPPYLTTTVNAWQSGQNGGYGFDPWVLDATANAGHFIANNPPNLSTVEAHAFGLWANNGGRATARRTFVEPLARSESLLLELDINQVSVTGSAGIAVLDDANQQRVVVYGQGSNYYITVEGVTTSLTVTNNTGSLLVLGMLDESSYYTMLLDRATVEELSPFLTGNLPAGRRFTGIEGFNLSAGPGPEFDFFMGQITIWAPRQEYVTFGPVEVVRIDTADRDGDGLPDSVETGTGIYLGAYDTGTDPDQPDSSGDGITDGEAALAGLNPNLDYRLVINVITSGVASTSGRFGLYTASTIMDLHPGDLVIRADGTNALLEFHVEISDDLQQWSTHDALPLLIPLQQDQQYIRILPPHDR